MTEIVTKTPDEFEQHFIDAMEKNYYVEDADDATHAGFIVLSRDGATRYSIPMSEYLRFIAS